MTNCSDKAHLKSLPHYEVGDILIWEVDSAAPGSLSVEAMGTLTDELNLGTWSVAPIGLDSGRAYFDLTLDQPIGLMEVKLRFGSLPNVY